MSVTIRTSSVTTQAPAPSQTPVASQELRVERPYAALMLLDPEMLRALSPFVRYERAAASVAEELGLPLSTLLYRLKRLRHAGLLELSRIERRAGSAIRHYRATSHAFFVPYHLTPLETPEALLEREHAPRQRRLERSLVRAGQSQFDGRGQPVFGVRVVLEGERLVVRNALGPDTDWNFLSPLTPAIVDLWAEDVRLEFEDAKALQAEMCDLLKRYRALSGPQGYIVRVAMAPLDETGR
jgi:DNA-binding transcriptional ArsR family regulator